jgi:branched-chain amino acid transport system ATP-binding protein
MTLIGKSVRVAYAGAVAVDGVDIEVPDRSITCVFGPNGAGKTSLLRALAGLVPVASGEVSFNGARITKIPAHRRVKLGVALVPEGRALFPDLSVDDNLRLGGYHLGAKARHEAVTRAYDLFPRIASRRKQATATLSGGEQQMVALARGLIGGPQVLMVDEPSLGLAPMIVEEILQHLRIIANDGLAVLLVEQSARRALTVADRALVLHRGRVVMSGDAEDLRRSNSMVSAYLGDGVGDEIA